MSAFFTRCKIEIPNNKSQIPSKSKCQNSKPYVLKKSNRIEKDILIDIGIIKMVLIIGIWTLGFI